MHETKSLGLSKKTNRAYQLYKHKLGYLGDEVPFAEFMRETYKFTRIVSKEIGKRSVCQKGCSHCCRLPVDVTLVEAQWIAAHLQQDKLSPAQSPQNVAGRPTARSMTQPPNPAPSTRFARSLARCSTLWTTPATA